MTVFPYKDVSHSHNNKKSIIIYDIDKCWILVMEALNNWNL